MSSKPRPVACLPAFRPATRGACASMRCIRCQHASWCSTSPAPSSCSTGRRANEAPLGLMARHRITLIPGDGIGPEVTSAVVRILETAGLDVEWEPHLAGAAALEKLGSTLPVELL